MKSRNQPLTNAEVAARIRQLPENIMVVGSYTCSNKKIACRCCQCQYKWTPTWSNLMKSKGCPQCLRLRKGVAEITQELARKFPTVKLLSKEYTGVYDHLRFECTLCGYKWNRSWHKLKSGKGCPQCQQDEQRLSIDEVRRRISKTLPNVILRSCKYKNTKTPLKCECQQCGNKWTSSWSCLRQGCGCLRCSRKASAAKSRLSLGEIRQKLKEIHPTIEVTSDSYLNNKSLLSLNCHKCNHKWEASWASLGQKHGCPQCNLDNSKLEQLVRATAEELTGEKFPRCRPPFTKGFGRQPLEIDCYNAKLKLGIEANGPHHYRLCHHNKWNPKRLLAQKRRDWRKRYQCWYHGVKLISVPHWIRDVKSYLSNRIPSTVKASL